MTRIIAYPAGRLGDLLIYVRRGRAVKLMAGRRRCRQAVTGSNISVRGRWRDVGARRLPCVEVIRRPAGRVRAMAAAQRRPSGLRAGKARTRAVVGDTICDGSSPIFLRPSSGRQTRVTVDGPPGRTKKNRRHPSQPSPTSTGASAHVMVYWLPLPLQAGTGDVLRSGRGYSETRGREAERRR